MEQDPDAVARGVAESITEAIGYAGISPDEIAGIGLTSQRNTIFPWYKNNGRSVANAITWQDLRTVPMLNELKEWGHGDKIRYRLGYGPGPYLASLHLAWRMRHETAVISAARANNLQLGLSTAWLINALGKPSGHKMDTSMVQSMGLYDIRNGDYWDEWLNWVGIGRDPLPDPVPTVHEFGTMCVTAPNGKSADVPVLAMIGDQQSALFGHGDRKPGSAECTHGTGSYVKVFIDNQTPAQEIIDVLCAWDLGERQTYCLEAATTVTGAAIRWLKDNGRIIDSYTELNDLAEAVPDTGGVIAIPRIHRFEHALQRRAMPCRDFGHDPRHRPAPHCPRLFGIDWLPNSRYFGDHFQRCKCDNRQAVGWWWRFGKRLGLPDSSRFTGNSRAASHICGNNRMVGWHFGWFWRRFLVKLR